MQTIHITANRAGLRGLRNYLRSKGASKKNSGWMLSDLLLIRPEITEMELGNGFNVRVIFAY